jgi:hypothetical protein
MNQPSIDDDSGGGGGGSSSSSSKASSNTPLFLFYSLQNVHVGGGDGLEAPQFYLDKCNMINSGDIVIDDDSYNEALAYCALVIMFDEAIGNTTCSLQENGILNNTIMIIASE